MQRYKKERSAWRRRNKHLLITTEAICGGFVLVSLVAAVMVSRTSLPSLWLWSIGVFAGMGMTFGAFVWMILLPE